MTIQEIFRRHQSGLETPIAHEGAYNEDLDFPDIEKMDLAEIQEMQDYYRDVIAQQRAELQAQKQRSAERSDLQSDAKPEPKLGEKPNDSPDKKSEKDS